MGWLFNDSGEYSAFSPFAGIASSNGFRDFHGFAGFALSDGFDYFHPLMASVVLMLFMVYLLVTCSLDDFEGVDVRIH